MPLYNPSSAVVLGGHDRASAVENGPRWMFCAASNGISSGRCYLMYVTPSVTTTVTKMSIISGGTVHIGATLIRLGIYTYDTSTLTHTLAARTASDTSMLLTQNTEYQPALDTTGGYPASYTLVAGTRYAFSYVVVGASQQPQIMGSTGTVNTVWGGLSPVIARHCGAQSDLPTSIASGSLNLNAGIYYLAALV